MKELRQRLSRLEARRSPLSNLDTGRKYFEAAVSAREASFTDDDRHLPRERVESMMLVDHFAWLRRFGEEADLGRVMALYGFTAPQTGDGYVMATTIIHGDATL